MREKHQSEPRVRLLMAEGRISIYHLLLIITYYYYLFIIVVINFIVVIIAILITPYRTSWRW